MALDGDLMNPSEPGLEAGERGQVKVFGLAHSHPDSIQGRAWGPLSTSSVVTEPE